MNCLITFFFFQAEDGIRDYKVTGVQTCALPILPHRPIIVLPFDRILERAALRMTLNARVAGLNVVHSRRVNDVAADRSEERRVGKSVDLGGRRIIKKKKKI